MVEPVEADFTNGSIVLRGEVTGGTPSSFEFLKGEEMIASLTGSFEYEWNIIGTDEGSYEITARATIDDTAYTSEPVTVTVDRTAPAVSSTPPADGSANVSSGTEITVTFSQAVDEEKLTSKNAHLLNGTGGKIGTARNLSDDGTTLTLDVLGTPEVPNTLTGSLSTGITDRAGNKLDAPAGWSWDVPAWQQLGGGISIKPDNNTYKPSIAFNSEGVPYIAFREFGPPNIIYVVSWDGSSWNQVGSAVSNTSISSTWPSIEVDSADHPVVVYEENDLMIVKRYEDGSWIQMGGALNNDPSEFANLPDLAVNSQDQTIVTWVEEDSGAGYIKIYVKKWNGVSFIQIGSELNLSAEEALSSYLASGSTPYISWSEYYATGGYYAAYVSEWSGSSWDWLGATVLNTFNYTVTEPIIKMNPQDEPVVEIGPGDVPYTAWAEDIDDVKISTSNDIMNFSLKGNADGSHREKNKENN